jgi:hypothetical protein
MKEHNVILRAREDRRQGFEEGLKQGRMAFAIKGPTDLEPIEAEPKQPPRKSNPPPPPPDTSWSKAEAVRVLLEITKWETLRAKRELHELEKDLDQERQKNKEGGFI